MPPCHVGRPEEGVAAGGGGMRILAHVDGGLPPRPTLRPKPASVTSLGASLLTEQAGKAIEGNLATRYTLAEHTCESWR